MAYLFMNTSKQGGKLAVKTGQLCMYEIWVCPKQSEPSQRMWPCLIYHIQATVSIYGGKKLATMLVGGNVLALKLLESNHCCITHN